MLFPSQQEILRNLHTRVHVISSHERRRLVTELIPQLGQLFREEGDEFRGAVLRELPREIKELLPLSILRNSHRSRFAVS